MASEDGIIVGIGGNIAGLQQSLKRATEAVKEASAKIGKEGFGELLKPLAAVGASFYTIHGLIEGLKGGLELGAEMQDLSARTGIAVENLVMLKAAFKEAGVDAEKIGPSINKMQKALQEAATTAGGSQTFRELGLNSQVEAKKKPDEAFRDVGTAISQIENPAQRAATAMKIFGKNGGELLQVFLNPAFRDTGMSEKAKVLGENAAVFKEAADILNHVGGKIQGFFAGFESNVVPALMPLFEAFNRIDLTRLGEQIGEVTGTFIEAFSEGKLGAVLFLSLKIAISEAVNFFSAALFSIWQTLPTIFGNLVSLFVKILGIVATPDFWKGVGDGLLSAAEAFNALMLTVLAAILDKLSSIPGLGFLQKGAASAKSAAVSENALAAQSQTDMGDRFAPAIQNLLSESGKGLNESFATLAENFSKAQAAPGVIDTSELQSTLQNTIGGIQNNLDAKNAEEREKAKNRRKGLDEGGDLEALGKGQNAFADSLRKIGGGGLAGGQSDPLLDENKRQTALLQQIATGLKNPAQRFAAGNESFRFAYP